MAIFYHIFNNDTNSVLNVDQPNAILSSMGDNSSLETYIDPENSPAYVFMRRLQTVIIPVICVLGVLGNVLAVFTFTSPVLYKTSCSWHLAAKCVFDIGFLLSLFVVWLYRIRVPLLTTTGVCQITVFLVYVCGCVSVWFVVMITTENFIRFTRGHLVHKYCTVKKAKCLVAILTTVSALFYSFSLWTTAVVSNHDGSRHCSTLIEFENVIVVTTVIDTAVTLVFPSLIMFFLVTYIAVKSMEAFERKRRLRIVSSRNKGNRSTPEGKMTTFLFAISVSFIIMNTPSHGIRTKMLINLYLGIHPTYSDFILQLIFEILFFFNFSTNCLIYLAFGHNFRTAFRSKYLRCRAHKDNSIHLSGNVSQVLLNLETITEESSNFLRASTVK